jgi:hypothetical protein
MTANARHVRLVDDHFAGRASPAAEAAMREHLPTCARCQRRYQRHLVLAKLDPTAPSAQERLATGLGLSLRRRRPPVALPFGAVAVAAVAISIAWPRAEVPQPRGAGVSPAVLIYRVGDRGRIGTVEAGVRPTDELAFAYTNPSERRYLLLYGQDEHGHVYWFHPGWPAGAPAPRAIAIRRGAGPYELPEAVRHRFDGRQLRVTAIFSDERLGVEAVERDGRALPSPKATPAAEVVSRSLEVMP